MILTHADSAMQRKRLIESKEDHAKLTGRRGGLRDWVQLKTQQYNVTSALYMLDWWERLIFNIFMASVFAGIDECPISSAPHEREREGRGGGHRRAGVFVCLTSCRNCTHARRSRSAGIRRMMLTHISMRMVNVRMSMYAGTCRGLGRVILSDGRSSPPQPHPAPRLPSFPPSHTPPSSHHECRHCGGHVRLLSQLRLPLRSERLSFRCGVCGCICVCRREGTKN